MYLLVHCTMHNIMKNSAKELCCQWRNLNNSSEMRGKIELTNRRSLPIDRSRASQCTDLSFNGNRRGDFELDGLSDTALYNSYFSERMISITLSCTKILIRISAQSVRSVVIEKIRRIFPFSFVLDQFFFFNKFSNDTDDVETSKESKITKVKERKKFFISARRHATRLFSFAKRTH